MSSASCVLPWKRAEYPRPRSVRWSIAGGPSARYRAARGATKVSKAANCPVAINPDATPASSTSDARCGSPIRRSSATAAGETLLSAVLSS